MNFLKKTFLEVTTHKIFKFKIECTPSHRVPFYRIISDIMA
nr:MAG TPA: hypothetical protein [Caudoviricetes sp.]